MDGKVIQLKTVGPDGVERIRTAGPTVTLDDIEGLAEAEVYAGYATYAAVLVDGEIYSELEA